MTPTSDLEALIERLRPLAEKATPGPWFHYRNKLRPNFGGIINEVQQKKRPPIIQWAGFDNSERTEKKHAANAAYIAAANPQVVMQLLDALSAALRLMAPFADYAPGPNQSYFRDEQAFTQGSPMAKRQLTYGDLRAIAHWRATGKERI